MYNLHPIVVHFPVALLTIYYVIQIIPVHRIFRKVNWQSVSDILLIIGVLGSLAALQTGETAEHMTTASHALVEMHSGFASFSTGVALILLGDRVIDWLDYWIVRYAPVVKKPIGFVLRIVRNRYIHILLAIVGIISLLITGLLGGVIVYGTTADPLAPMVLRILGLA